MYDDHRSPVCDHQCKLGQAGSVAQIGQAGAHRRGHARLDGQQGLPAGMVTSALPVLAGTPVPQPRRHAARPRRDRTGTIRRDRAHCPYTTTTERTAARPPASLRPVTQMSRNQSHTAPGCLIHPGPPGNRKHN